jgi:hypothetical protein
MRFLLSIALILALMTSAEAFKIIGAGVDSCGTWMADRHHPRSPDALQDEQWVLGFLSGVGYEGGEGVDPLNDMEANGVWAWIDNYCQAYPIETITTAAKAFNSAHPH